MKIIIGADIVSTAGNEKEFITGDVEKLVGKELKAILDDADFIIANLEVPLRLPMIINTKFGAFISSIQSVEALNLLRIWKHYKAKRREKFSPFIIEFLIILT